MSTTSIIYNNVNKQYAKFDKAAKKWRWVPDPADATVFKTPETLNETFSNMEKSQGPALDGSLEKKDQISEVKRRQPGRYEDSDTYEDGDDTDTA